ncbi:MAG TPA: M14 family metallopeptidase [Acidobacteriota bacterium]|nr:M14 family metallopeptidase [Acidobacteriota bacterium]
MKKSSPSSAIFVFAVLLFSVAVVWAGQVPLSLEYDVEGVEYSSEIPLPEDVIGHQVGTRHTRAHQLVDYYRAVAEVSDRVILRQHGRTYEGRPLVHAIVTSPSNHARLEEIRQANLALSDPASDISERRLRNQPGVIYLGYSVHGNEATGSEAALLTLYHLAAGSGSPVEQALENLVIILDPAFNPDGRDRFVNWVNGNRGRVATIDSQDREHREPWPGGRTNHYWFDLNRDWLPAQLKESQARLEIYHHWKPQILTDHHEMGGDATFFFQPGIPSRNNPYTPQRTFDLTAEIAEYHARRLDDIGALYYSEESFDDFYYGKGSTYPDVNGAVGILFEQASSRGLRRETDLGELSYAYGIRNHFSASLSTIEAAVEMRPRLLAHMRDFYAEAPQIARQDPVKAFIFSCQGSQRTRGQALAQLLRRHRIKVHELARDSQAAGVSFKAGEAYVVPLDQPQIRLIKALFEPMTEFNDVLFYDVSTWVLPMAFDVDHASWEAGLSGLLGSEVEQPQLDGGGVEGQSDYAYLMRWGGFFAPRALYRLLQAGLYPRLAVAEFEARVEGGLRSYPAGTVIIPLNPRDAQASMTPQQARNLLQDIARQDHVVFEAAQGGLTPSGADLGGPSMEVIPKPSVALLSGSGTSAYQVGQVWHLLNERMGLPVTLLDMEDFDNADLDDYNTLVLVSGFYGRLNADKLKGWVRAGGTLIAIHNAARWAVEQELVTGKLFEPEDQPEDVPYDQVRRQRGAQVIGGSIFEVELDTTHPLAFGYGPRMAFFRNHTSFFEVSQQPGVTVASYTDSPLLSGYVSQENLQALAGSAALLASRSGGGRVVLFADDPTFRAFWYGTSGVFLNAVFFGPLF